jgi:hypothetical protein
MSASGMALIPRKTALAVSCSLIADERDCHIFMVASHDSTDRAFVSFSGAAGVPAPAIFIHDDQKSLLVVSQSAKGGALSNPVCRRSSIVSPHDSSNIKMDIPNNNERRERNVHGSSD